MMVYLTQLGDRDVQDFGLIEDAITEVPRIRDIVNVRRRSAKYVSRLLLLYALHNVREVQDKIWLDRREYGKPFIHTKEKIDFSISYSGNMVACAAHTDSIGLDLEVKERRNSHQAEIPGRFFSKDEITYIGENAERYRYIFTRKEAYCKFTGKGLHQPISAVDVIRLACSREVSFHTFCHAGATISVCVPPDDGIVCEMMWIPDYTDMEQFILERRLADAGV